MAVGNAKLREEMAVGNEKLRGEMAAGNEKLRVDMARTSADLREEMNNMHRKLVMWIVSTMVAMFLGMVGLFIGLTSAMIDAAFKPGHATASVLQAPAPQAPR
jgi:hypothetical protein